MATFQHLRCGMYACSGLVDLARVAIVRQNPLAGYRIIALRGGNPSTTGTLRRQVAGFFPPWRQAMAPAIIRGAEIESCVTGRELSCICQETGFQKNTHLHSLRTFGRAKDLPAEDELSLIPPCGLVPVSMNRIIHRVRSIRDGELTTADAAADTALPCKCGIGNHRRAQRIFERLLKPGG
jgi:hypothetical protein